ncbi:predicted protein [Lichtheimia corymbifera JMRC:FSU:9682]|uniref:Uncharacterized protein n=1 Tax=Lichtheimia corymbifera JMRC:FSU:9682 TaxID=1263082 RepID=A0A068S8E6_9FUNG|nr:predicted protein [Lichtheimia corymbifera JMRC:FSU:9682]
MDFVLDGRHSPPIDNALVRPTPIHNDQADPCLHEPIKQQQQQLRFLAAPPPSPQDASLLESVFAAKRHHGKLPCSVQARTNSGSDMDNDHHHPQQQQQETLSSTSTTMQQHASLLSRLLQQTASSSSSSMRSRTRPYTPRQHTHHYHGVSVSRRHVGSTHHKHHRSGHVHKPSRIPIISSRLRARAALHKATNELADAIATVHLSSPRQQQQQQHNEGDNAMAEE